MVSPCLFACVLSLVHCVLILSVSVSVCVCLSVVVFQPQRFPSLTCLSSGAVHSVYFIGKMCVFSRPVLFKMYTYFLCIISLGCYGRVIVCASILFRSSYS
ncbi:unnamed protein product [Pylaiella littoralis]